MLEKVIVVFSCLVLSCASHEDAYFYHQHEGGDIQVHFHEDHHARPHDHSDNASLVHDIDGHHFHVFGPLHIHIYDDDQIGDHHVHHHHADSHDNFDHPLFHENSTEYNISDHAHSEHHTSDKDDQHDKMSADELAYHHKKHPRDGHDDPNDSLDHDDPDHHKDHDHGDYHDEHDDNDSLDHDDPDHHNDHDHGDYHDEHDHNDSLDKHKKLRRGHKHNNGQGDEKRYSHRMKEMHKMHNMDMKRKMHGKGGMKSMMGGMKSKMDMKMGMKMGMKKGMKMDMKKGMKMGMKMDMKKCRCCPKNTSNDSYSHELEGTEHPAFVFARCDVVPNTRLSRENRGGNIRGTALLKQHYKDGPLLLDISLKGFKVRDTVHGIHVHQYGEMTDSCESLGPHFNPTAVDHGGPDADPRHFGDLGNIHVDKRGRVNSSTKHTKASLIGHLNIVGRSLVIHEHEDDLGLGKTEASRQSGDSGRRVACCVIVRCRGDK